MNKTLSVLIKIFLIVGIGLLIYTFKRYQNWVNTPFDPGIPKYVLEQEFENREMVNLRELYKVFNYEYLENNLGYEFKGIYYSEEKMTDKFYIYMGILPLIKEEIKINCNLNKEISSGEVDLNIKKMFGNINYSKINFEFKDKSVKVGYDNIKDIYIVRTTKCSGIDYKDGGVKTEYLKAYQGSNMAIIEEEVYYLKTLISFSNIVYNYYSGIDDSSNISSNSLEKLNKDKLPKYNLVFERKGNDYYFRLVKRIS